MFIRICFNKSAQKIELFNEHIAEYEAWFKKYPFIFRSEVAAIRKLIPKGKNLKGIEIGLASGHFAKTLGIREGIEPANKMRELAQKKKIFVLKAKAEKLPHKSLQFDFVLMNFCISYFEDLPTAFEEAYRVLKRGGSLIVSVIDKTAKLASTISAEKQIAYFIALRLSIL